MRNLYYKRDGTPYAGVEEWSNDFEKRAQKTVAQTNLWNGFWVSTVWLGLDHNFAEDGLPLIFESMVFWRGKWSELDMRRYSTEEEARQGHAELVRKWSRWGWFVWAWDKIYWRFKVYRWRV